MSDINLNKSSEGSISSKSSTEFSIENRSDHSETRLMKSEWTDIKKMVYEININTPKFDWISLLSGAVLSTLISSIIGVVKEWPKQLFSAETVVYMGITIALCVILILCCMFCKSTKNLDEAKIYSDYLKDKIKTIDERIASDNE